MKRNFILTIFSLVTLLGCTSDEFNLYEEPLTITDELYIPKSSGIKLEKYIVEEEVKINIKPDQDGTYRIKILDIGGTTISQEKIDILKGDNILKVYVKALPASSYTVSVLNVNGSVVGTQVFSKN